MAVGLAGIVLLVSGEWKASLASMLIFFGLLPPWGEWFDIGRMGGSFSDDLTGMTGRGLVLTVLPGVALNLLGYGPWVLLSGASMGIIYAFCWWFHEIVSLERGKFLDGPTSAAEFLFMGLVFLVAALSLGAT